MLIPLKLGGHSVHKHLYVVFARTKLACKAAMQPAGGDCKNVWRGAAGIRCENGDRSNLMYPASTESNAGVQLGISFVHQLKTEFKIK